MCVYIGAGMLVMLCVTFIVCGGYLSFKVCISFKVSSVEYVSFIEIYVWCS